MLHRAVLLQPSVANDIVEPQEADGETEALAQSARIETEIVWVGEGGGPEPIGLSEESSQVREADADNSTRSSMTDGGAEAGSLSEAPGAGDTARKDDCAHSQTLSASALQPCAFGEASLLAALNF